MKNSILMVIWYILKFLDFIYFLGAMFTVKIFFSFHRRLVFVPIVSNFSLFAFKPILFA